MNEYLITKLKEGRTNKGLKQSDVATKIGVKGNTLSNYENGVSEPDIDTFCALCDIYDLDAAELLGEAYGLGVQGSDFSIKPSEIEYIKKYRDLDEHGKKMVDFTLQEEYERSKAEKKKADNVVSMEVKESNTYEVNAAHADDYMGAPEELRQQEEDMINKAFHLN